MSTKEQLRRADVREILVECVRAHMPWPFSDVDRDSAEATEAAHAIVTDEIVTHFDREFESLRKAT